MLEENTTTLAGSLEDVADLDDLMPTRFSAPGTELLMGEMRGIMAALPVVSLVGLGVDEVIPRRDYEVEGIEPGNRAMSEEHVRRIKAGLKKHANKFVTGCFTLGIHPDGVNIERKLKLA